MFFLKTILKHLWPGTRSSSCETPPASFPAPKSHITLITWTHTWNCRCQWRHVSSLHHWAWSLSEQKIPFWPWEGNFQWRDIPKATEEAAPHKNVSLFRLAQQSLSHMTSLNSGSSAQSYQAHNPVGFPVQPEKDEMEEWVPVDVYLSLWDNRKPCWTVVLVGLGLWPPALNDTKAFPKLLGLSPAVVECFQPGPNFRPTTWGTDRLTTIPRSMIIPGQ